MSEETSKRKILKMGDPIISSFHNHADLLSVLACYEESFPWIYSNYIQLEMPNISYHSGHKYRLDFYMPNSWETCPFINFQKISRELASNLFSDIIDFFKLCINNNLYIYIYADTFYLYNQDHYAHDCFIFGYDDDSQMIYYADYLEKRKYSYSTKSYDQMRKAYENIQDTAIGRHKGKNMDCVRGIEMFSFAHERPGGLNGYSFEVKDVTEKLEDYLNSYNPNVQNLPSALRYKRDWDYGISIYGRLHRYLQELLEDNIRFDPKIFHVLYQHKKVMNKRFEFLLVHSYLDQITYETNCFLEIEDKAKLILSLFIKWSVTNDNQLIDRINALLFEIEYEEVKKIERIISVLQKNNF